MFSIPVDVRWEVRGAQYIAVFLMVLNENDLMHFFDQFMKGFDRRVGAFKIRFGSNPNKTPEQNEEDRNEGVLRASDLVLPKHMKTRWMIHMGFRLLVGVLNNVVTFALIMHQTHVVQVLLMFAGLGFVATLDNLAFVSRSVGETLHPTLVHRSNSRSRWPAPG